MNKIKAIAASVATSVIAFLGFSGCGTQKKGVSEKIDRDQIRRDLEIVKPLYGVQRPPLKMMRMNDAEKDAEKESK